MVIIPIETLKVRNIYFGKLVNALIVEDSFHSQRSEKAFLDKVRIEFQDCPLSPPARLSETYLKYHGKKRSGGSYMNCLPKCVSEGEFIPVE